MHAAKPVSLYPALRWAESARKISARAVSFGGTEAATLKAGEIDGQIFSSCQWRLAIDGSNFSSATSDRCLAVNCADSAPPASSDSVWLLHVAQQDLAKFPRHLPRMPTLVLVAAKKSAPIIMPLDEQLDNSCAGTPKFSPPCGAWL